MNTTELLNAISFAFMIVFPNLALMGLGFWLKRQAVIDTNFIDVASKIVFNFGLPCLLFFSVIKSDVNIGEQAVLIVAGVVTTFVLFFGAEIYARFFVPDAWDKGVFVQGVFRSNMAIISLSVVANAYGDAGTSVGAVYMGLITILYNVLSVITLSRTQVAKGFTNQAIDILKKIITNPLIIALVSAFVYQGVGLPMPPAPITKTGELLSSIALPLALICAGATQCPLHAGLVGGVHAGKHWADCGCPFGGGGDWRGVWFDPCAVWRAIYHGRKPRCRRQLRHGKGDGR